MAYVTRGRHHAKWAKTDERGCGHLEVLIHLRRNFPVQMKAALMKLEELNLAVLDQQLEALTQIPASVPLTEDRKHLYIKLLSVRQNRILKAMS